MNQNPEQIARDKIDQMLIEPYLMRLGANFRLGAGND